jgi:uncharacterized protein (TIGR03086 family)
VWHQTGQNDGHFQIEDVIMTEQHDPRPLLADAVALTGDVIAAIAPEQFSLPTPCPAFDVRALLGHVNAVGLRIAAMGRQEDVFSTPDSVDQPDGEWSAAWSASSSGIAAAWADPSLLTQMFELPWTTSPGSDIIAMYVSELTVHAWDLAKATGQHPNWNAAAVALSMAVMQGMLPADGRVETFEAVRAAMPEGMEGFAPPFAARVEVPADAPAIDHLIAWTGRRP